jgi:PPP family 3-phenylpropionic acid transporter
LKDSLRELFRNKMILCILATSLVFGLTMTFYHAFLGIQLRAIGASEVQVGRAMFISAASEVPVLLLVNKIFGRRKPVHLLMIIGFFMAARLVMLFTADMQSSLHIVYAAQLLHGLTFMVHFYFTVVLLNAHAPVHIKSTVQSLNAVIRAAAALIGAGIGGTMADRLGIGGVYLILSVFIFTLCFILPGVLSLIYRGKVRAMPPVT